MRRRFMLSRSKIEPLFFEALTDDFSFSFDRKCEYSLNGGDEWTVLEPNAQSPIIKTGEKIFLRSNLVPGTMSGAGKFIISKPCNLGGNPISLLYVEQLVPNAFNYLFEGCVGIVDASRLQLSETTLAESCYKHMFARCTSLTTAPELPATTLAEYCYYYMFSGCSKLNYIKMLATDISADGCLKNWVTGVSSTGTFVKNSAMMSLSTGASGIPSSWTVVNDENVFNIVDGSFNFLVSGNLTFDEGMTWQEFVNSDYNIENKFGISSEGFVLFGAGGTYKLYEKYASVVVYSNDIIKPTDYSLVGTSGGSGGSDN